MRGQGVCAMHAGKAPMALAKAADAIERAQMRLRGLTPLAIDAIERLLREADSEAAILGAARDVLDRSGLKAKDQIELDTTITVTRPW